MPPDIWVMLRPGEAFAQLAGGDSRSLWIALRRPLLILLVLAAVGSLATSGRISLRLLLACAAGAVYIPLFLLLSIIVARGRAVSLARAIDLFFMGHGPWTLWLVALGAEWAFLPPERAYELLAYRNLWYLAGFLAFLWSVIIDFWYLRRVFAKTAAQATRWLLLQRVVVWTTGMAIFLGNSGWQVICARLGW